MELLETYRRLVSLRRSSPALTHGGIRYAHVSADAIVYLREARDETVLCLAARAEHERIRLPLAALGGGRFETLIGADLELERGDVVLPSAGPSFHAWQIV